MDISVGQTTGDISSIFPDIQQQFSKEVEDEANSYFQRIYNQPPTPTMSIDEVLDMLKRFKDSPDKKEKVVKWSQLHDQNMTICRCNCSTFYMNYAVKVFTELRVLYDFMYIVNSYMYFYCTIQWTFHCCTLTCFKFTYTCIYIVCLHVFHHYCILLCIFRTYMSVCWGTCLKSTDFSLSTQRENYTLQQYCSEESLRKD